MRTWGVSALSHDASLAVVEDGRILFAAHSERYSRVKNDPFLHPALIAEARIYGPPDCICWYERPTWKRVRYMRARQWGDMLDPNTPSQYLRSVGVSVPKSAMLFSEHHLSHAAGGFATSGWDESVVIVADAIGEFRTFSIYLFRVGHTPKLLHRRSYPHSLGLLYSAFTRRCGFKPNEDEYIVMGLAGFGEPRFVDQIYQQLIVLEPPSYRLRVNPHRGIGQWMPGASPADLAASIQFVTEEVMLHAARWAYERTSCDSLVLMGGLALNCVMNSRLATDGPFKRHWIFPNPGDAGSSLGAIAASIDAPIFWESPYLGTSILGDYPVDAIVDELSNTGMVAVASGRAEFGPRALGNRSLIADPTLPDMQNMINHVKGREPFRPFAPIVREEIAHELFSLPVERTPYMQFVARCLQPHLYPAIVHVDGTSRVQTVGVDDHAGLHALLMRWEEKTGGRILLNTSLNKKGEPLVNTMAEARSFGERTGLRVVGGM